MLAEAIEATKSSEAWAAYVSGRGRVYVPRAGDPVLGFVDDRGGEAYRVALPGACFGGVLGIVAFDGATRRNRPQLQLGDAVYARVATASPGVEPRLTCCAEDAASAVGWMTSGAAYGKLECDATTCVVRSSVSPGIVEATLLPALRGHMGDAVRIKLGRNGLAWVKAAKTTDTTCAATALINAARLPCNEIASMVDHVVANVHATRTLATSAVHS